MHVHVQRGEGAVTPAPEGRSTATMRTARQLGRAAQTAVSAARERHVHAAAACAVSARTELHQRWHGALLQQLCLTLRILRQDGHAASTRHLELFLGSSQQCNRRRNSSSLARGESMAIVQLSARIVSCDRLERAQRMQLRAARARRLVQEQHELTQDASTHAGIPEGHGMKRLRDGRLDRHVGDACCSLLLGPRRAVAQHCQGVCQAVGKRLLRGGLVRVTLLLLRCSDPSFIRHDTHEE